MRKPVHPNSLKNLQPPIKKGEVRNPRGGRAHDPGKRALRTITIESYRKIIELILTSNLTELKRLAEDPATIAIEVAICNAFFKALKIGDFDTIERITSRIVGKVPDVINVNETNETTILVIDQAKLKHAMKSLESEF